MNGKERDEGTRKERGGGRMPEKEKRRKEDPSLVSRVNSIFDCLASRHSRLRQGSKIDYSSITLRLVPSSTPPSQEGCILLLSRLNHRSNFHSSSRPSLFSPCSPGPIGPGLPSSFPPHLLRGSSSSPPFRYSVIASRSWGLSASRGVP